MLFPSPPATAARVIDRFEEGEDGEGDFLAVGNIRKLASASLLDTDKRYSGKTTSRKAWKEDQWEHPLSGSSGEWIHLHVFFGFCLFFAWYSFSFFPNFLGLKFPLPLLMNFARLVYVPPPMILREIIDLALERALEVLNFHFIRNQKPEGIKLLHSLCLIVHCKTE